MARSVSLLGTLFVVVACGSNDEHPNPGSGGSGGAGNGGGASGGASSGGSSGGGGSGGVASSGGASAGGAGSGGSPSSGGNASGGTTASGGTSGPSPRDHFDGITRRPDVPATPVADCAGKPDMALCRVVTTPDRDYDVCVEGVCVSPGCGEPSCNVPSPHFPIPPGSQHTFLEKVSGAEPTVADLVTGLEWLACPLGTKGADCAEGAVEKITRDEALARCDALSWGGKDDWYLPDSFEVMSIVDKGQPEGIDESFFRYPDEAVWTSHGSASSLRIIYFRPARSGGRTFITDEPNSSPYAAFCVRRGASGDVGYTGERFQISESAEPVVADRVTGLSWQRCTAGRTGPDCREGGRTNLPYSQWRSHCDTLQWGGASDWRVPTHKEFYSLIEFSRLQTVAPRIDHLTFDVFNTEYLGATVGWEPDDTVVLFDVTEGTRTGPNSDATYPLLCVRWTEP